MLDMFLGRGRRISLLAGIVRCAFTDWHIATFASLAVFFPAAGDEAVVG